MADSGEVIVKVVRPLKLIGCVCACIGVLLIVLAIVTCHWLEADGFHQGLWQFCIINGGLESCSSTSDQGWITITLGLCLIAVLFGLIGSCLGIAGLFMMRRSKCKTKSFFCIASIMIFLAVCCVLGAVTLYAVMFVNEIDKYRHRFQIWQWYFSWSYGVAWGAAIFFFGAGVLLALRRDSDTVVYRERNGRVVHN